MRCVCVCVCVKGLEIVRKSRKPKSSQVAAFSSTTYEVAPYFHPDIPDSFFARKLAFGPSFCGVLHCTLNLLTRKNMLKTAFPKPKKAQKFLRAPSTQRRAVPTTPVKPRACAKMMVRLGPENRSWIAWIVSKFHIMKHSGSILCALSHEFERAKIHL